MTKEGKIINLHKVPNNITARLQWHKTLKDSLTLDFILGGHVKPLVWVFCALTRRPCPCLYFIMLSVFAIVLFTVAVSTCRWSTFHLYYVADSRPCSTCQNSTIFLIMLPSDFSSINWTPVWCPAEPCADTLPMKIMPTGKKLSHFPTVIVFYTNTTYVI